MSKLEKVSWKVQLPAAVAAEGEQPQPKVVLELQLADELQGELPTATSGAKHILPTAASVAAPSVAAHKYDGEYACSSVVCIVDLLTCCCVLQETSL